VKSPAQVASIRYTATSLSHKRSVINSFHRGRDAKYCDEYVCLSVRLHISETTQPNFVKLLCTLRVTVARSFSDGVAIRYVLPVL